MSCQETKVKSSPLVLLSAIGALLLSACGGGNTAPAPVVTVPPKTLKLQGLVEGAARLAGAAVTVTAGGVRYTTTVASDGTYKVDLLNYTATDFITVRAKGTGNSAGLELLSLIGTAGAVETLAGIDKIATIAEVDGLQVGSVDTAKAGLIQLRKSTTVAKVAVAGKADNPDSPVQTDQELATAEQALDPQEVVQVASIIQVVVDNAEIALPAGTSSTLAFAQQTSDDRADFVAEVVQSYPEEYDAASNSVAATESDPLTEADIPPTVYYVSASSEQFPYVAREFTFNTDKTGNTSTGATFTWSVSNNTLLVNYAQTSTTTRRDLNNNGTPNDDPLIAVMTKIDDTFFVASSDVDAIADIIRKSRVVNTFPNNPELATESYTVTEVGLAVDEDGTVPRFTTAELAGKTYALESGTTRNANGVTLGATALKNDFRTRIGDEMTFNADGTGSAVVAGAFTWTQPSDDDGIQVTLASGDRLNYYKLRALSDGAMLVGRIFTPAGGTEVLSASVMVEVDPAARLPLAGGSVPGLYQYNGAGSTAPAEVFYSLGIRLDADGTGAEVVADTRNAQGQPGGSVTRSFDYPIASWSLSTDGRTLIADTTFDNSTNTYNCVPSTANTSCVVEDHRELHVVKVVDNRIYTRFYETFPSSGGLVQSSIIRFDYEVPSTTATTSAKSANGGVVKRAKKVD